MGSGGNSVAVSLVIYFPLDARQWCSMTPFQTFVWFPSLFAFTFVLHPLFSLIIFLVALKTACLFSNYLTNRIPCDKSSMYYFTDDEYILSYLHLTANFQLHRLKNMHHRRRHRCSTSSRPRIYNSALGRDSCIHGACLYVLMKYHETQAARECIYLTEDFRG